MEDVYHDICDTNYVGSFGRRRSTNFDKFCQGMLFTNNSLTRIIDDSALDEAHSRLLTVARLVEDNYGPEMITPNIHLSLHLTECCRDYGPMYAFWCYSFERMNGILGK